MACPIASPTCSLRALAAWAVRARQIAVGEQLLGEFGGSGDDHRRFSAENISLTYHAWRGTGVSSRWATPGLG